MIKVKQTIYLIILLIWNTHVTGDERQAELPSTELLEFLGDGENVDGEWMDPLHMIELQDSETVSKENDRTSVYDFLGEEEQIDRLWAGPLNMIELQARNTSGQATGDTEND